jgi:hypothetical protein
VVSHVTPLFLFEKKRALCAKIGRGDKCNKLEKLNHLIFFHNYKLTFYDK